MDRRHSNGAGQRGYGPSDPSGGTLSSASDHCQVEPFYPGSVPHGAVSVLGLVAEDGSGNQYADGHDLADRDLRDQSVSLDRRIDQLRGTDSRHGGQWRKRAYWRYHATESFAVEMVADRSLLESGTKRSCSDDGF